MKNPEKTTAYRNGEFSRRTGKGKEFNPYRPAQGVKYYLWLAGWNDKDIELNSIKREI